MELSPTSDWQRQSATFNSSDYSQALLAFRWLGTAQIDELELRRLFSSYDEAVADGQRLAALRQTEAERYEAAHPQPSPLARQAEEQAALRAMGAEPVGELTYAEASVQPRSPSFASATGWQTKVGTYKGGDQRLNTVQGKTCWNAWWSGLGAAQGRSQTLEIRQEVSGLPEGVYALSCKATTEHYCLTDQRGYLVQGADTAFTTPLRADYFDLPTVASIWETLTTLPVYVAEGGTVTVGFASSKQGAVDNAWHRFGNFADSDKREGWWCATDFQLLYHPLHKFYATPGQWQTVCLPYAFNPPAGVRLYQIAGLLADYEHVCLEEVTQTVAGTPYIYMTDAPSISFYEYGDEARSALTTANKLRGFFKTSARAPVGYYALTDGEWRRVVDERPSIANYSALIRQADGMTVIPSWDGPTMKIHGVKDELGLSDAIDQPKADAARPDASYTLGGAKAGARRQLRIDVAGGKGRKVVR